MTLRWRIALLLALVALGVGASAAAAAYLSTASQLRSSVDDTLRARATAVNADSGRGGGGGGPDGDGHPDGACPNAGSLSPASAAQIVGDDGSITSCLAGSVTLPVTDGERNLRDNAVEVRTVRVDGARYRVLSTPWRAGGTLQIGRDLAESDSLLNRLRLQLLAFVLAAVVVAAGLGWTIATRLARPIVRLRDATHRIATTLDLSTPIDVTASGEVGGLAASFSTMVAAVGRSQEQQRRLVSDASHEMRTPLTSLRGNVELLGRIERLPATERQEVVAEVLDDIDELAALLGELVDLASDLGAAEVEEPVHLGDLARAVAARTQRRNGRAVTVEDAGALEVVGRPRQLERAIANLVENAVKYSGTNTPIEVEIGPDSVTVRDRGRGIAPEDLDHVFDRFYRAVDVRTEPGSGLGLSIVDEIVRTHGGTVFARAREGGGAEVGFTLPA
jgi:two-component system sensor histidine kinase MprB